MRKKIKYMAIIVAVAIMLIGCKKDENKKEIALITNGGEVTDGAYNQAAWESVEKFAKENSLGYASYKMKEESEKACKNAVVAAIDAGAEVIVCRGEVFEVPIFELQQEYTKVKFIVLDATIHDNKAVDATIRENTCVVEFKEEQAGFLAGYAAVIEGNKKLGFMGGQQSPQVKQYGSGFIQGAEYAAKELGYTSGSVNVKYRYVGDAKLSPLHLGLAKKWYEDGCEVIFNCAGLVDESIIMAAEKQEGKKIIACDVDQSAKSEYIVTSAVKDISSVVYELLEKNKNDKFPGGKKQEYGVKEKGIILPMSNSKFQNFSVKQYEEIHKLLGENKIKVDPGDIISGEYVLTSDLVTVQYEEE